MVSTSGTIGFGLSCQSSRYCERFAANCLEGDHKAAATDGLEARDGEELLVADTPQAMADAIARLHEDPSLAPAVIAAGRARLATAHAPTLVAQRLAALITAAAEGRAELG